MARFDILDMIPPVEGMTTGARWNGWHCPYFEKAEAMAIMRAWRAYYGENEADDDIAWFDDERQTFCFWNPDSDAIDEWSPTTMGRGRGETVLVWAIGAYGWTWEREADLEGGTPR